MARLLLALALVVSAASGCAPNSPKRQEHHDEPSGGFDQPQPPPAPPAALTTCPTLPQIVQSDLDTELMAPPNSMAPLTAMDANSGDCTTQTGTPQLYYTDSAGKIQQADKMDCANGQWSVIVGNTTTAVPPATAVCCSVKPCVALSTTLITPQNLDTALNRMGPSTVTAPIPTVTDATCDTTGATPTFYYTDAAANPSIIKADRIECSDGQWFPVTGGNKGTPIAAAPEVGCST